MWERLIAKYKMPSSIHQTGVVPTSLQETFHITKWWSSVYSGWNGGGQPKGRTRPRRKAETAGSSVIVSWGSSQAAEPYKGLCTCSIAGTDLRRPTGVFTWGKGTNIPYPKKSMTRSSPIEYSRAILALLFLQAPGQQGLGCWIPCPWMALLPSSCFFEKSMSEMALWGEDRGPFFFPLLPLFLFPHLPIKSQDYWIVHLCNHINIFNMCTDGWNWHIEK